MDWTVQGGRTGASAAPSVRGNQRASGARRLRQVLRFLNRMFQRRPCPERVAEGRGLPNPFGCTCRHHTVTWGGGRWGWGPNLGRSDVTLQRGPAPAPSQPEAASPLPTPGPARHPCNLIPEAAAGTAGWDRLSPPPLPGGCPPKLSSLVPPPAWRRGVAVPSPPP